jgi:calcineurin-like phosphoesterase family protein
VGNHGYVIHFNHANIIKYEDRPENFKELIIENCQKMIGENDTIIHLGDVIFSRKGELEDILKSIPGTKHLCKGNHDGESDDWYIRKGFATCRPFIIHEGILFSHKPMDLEKVDTDHSISQLKYNIHGHFHRKERDENDRTAGGYPFYSEKHLKLSIEEMDYSPIELKDFLTLKGITL